MSEEDYLGYAILRGVESENVLQIWESVIRHDPIINNYLHTLNIMTDMWGLRPTANRLEFGVVIMLNRTT